MKFNIRHIHEDLKKFDRTVEADLWYMTHDNYGESSLEWTSCVDTEDQHSDGVNLIDIDPYSIDAKTEAEKMLTRIVAMIRFDYLQTTGGDPESLHVLF